jgi:hypothetical protein
MGLMPSASVGEHTFIWTNSWLLSASNRIKHC